MNIFDLNNKEFFDHDLVARVMYDDAGSVPHDTDVTYLVRQDGQNFSGMDNISEREIIEFLEQEGGITVFFVRWEPQGEWSML